MPLVKTSPVLVPPPPVPPGGRIAAASQEPSPEPSGDSSRTIMPTGLIAGIVLELKQVVWPSRREVCSATLVTAGLLFFFAGYAYLLDTAADALFQTLSG